MGKSTLVNTIVGATLSIVTPKAQTTRNRINTIHTTESYQMILVDTPGIHNAASPLNKAMTMAAEKTLEDADGILFMVTPDKEIHGDDLRIIELIKSGGGKCVLAINKIDTVRPGALLPIMDSFSKMHDFEAITPISSKTGDGVEELVEALVRLLPQGPPLFSEDDMSDQPVRFFVQEIIREQLTLLTGQEIPYKSAVIVEGFEEKGNIIVISADVHCEKQSQKKIIIGKDGKMIKTIGQRSREKIEDFLQSRVHLELFVKVSPGWTKKDSMLREFGYLVK